MNNTMGFIFLDLDVVVSMLKELGIDFVQQTWEGDCFSDMLSFADPRDHPFNAKSKS